MKQNKFIYLKIGIFLIIVSFLLLFHLYSYLKTDRNTYQKEIQLSFNDAIRKDLTIRAKGLTENFSFGKTFLSSGDSTTIHSANQSKTIPQKQLDIIDEKQSVSIQTILYKKENPLKAEVLDSLFQIELKQRNIDLHSCVVVIDKGKDSSSYSNISDVSQLQPISDTLLFLDLEDELAVQAFTNFSTWFVLKNMPSYNWYITGGWLLLVFGLSISIPVFQKRAKKKMSQQLINQVAEFSEPEPLPFPVPDSIPLPEKSNAEVISFTDDLFFNNQTKSLFYNKREVEMTAQQTKFLQKLIEAPDYFLSIEDIKNKVWETDAITLDSIQQSISRLNKVLEMIPGLIIVNVKRGGYQLQVPMD